MNIDPRKSEYGLLSCSHIKYEESQALHDEVEAFVARGGKIRNLSNNTHADHDYSLFDKRKDELASLARINRRKTFNFQCQKHGVTKHQTRDMCCVKCVNDEKLKTLEKHGVANG